MTTDELVAGSRSYVDEGFPAVKLRVGVRQPADDIARVAAVRAAVGAEVGITVDANERLDLATAWWMAPRLAELEVLWFEEPVPSRLVDPIARWRPAPTPPLAVGEHVLGLSGFTAFTDSAPVWMPDVPLTGGVPNSCASTRSPRRTEPRSPGTSSPSCMCISSWRAGPRQVPLLDDLLAAALVIKDGEAAPSARSGHGLLWDDHKIAAHTVHTHERRAAL